MTGWPLAPLRRLRGHQAREAALALAGALEAEAAAALEVRRRLLAAEAAALALAEPAGGARPEGSPPLRAASLAGAAACAGRHAEVLLEARAAARRTAGAVEAGRTALLEARAAARALESLEARWGEARRRARERRAEAADDDLAWPGRPRSDLPRPGRARR